jgi:IPTL-CTERM motif
MKKIRTLLLIIVFALACSSLFAQLTYHGNVKPVGYTNVAPVRGFPINGQLCNPCAIPNNEPDILDGQDDVTNGGCNDPLLRFTPISMGANQCGRINGYIKGDDMYRDIDWYSLHVAAAQTVYVSGIMNGADYGILGIIGADCENFPVYASDWYAPGVATTISAPLPAGDYWILVTVDNFGPGIGGDYMIKVSDIPVGPPQTWCEAASIPTLTQWGLIILGLAGEFDVQDFLMILQEQTGNMA